MNRPLCTSLAVFSDKGRHTEGSCQLHAVVECNSSGQITDVHFIIIITELAISEVI